MSNESNKGAWRWAEAAHEPAAEQAVWCRMCGAIFRRRLPGSSRTICPYCVGDGHLITLLPVSADECADHVTRTRGGPDDDRDDPHLRLI